MAEQGLKDHTVSDRTGLPTTTVYTPFFVSSMGQMVAMTFNNLYMLF